MARQKRARSKSGYYHILLRGNEKRNIFLDEEDRLRFIETMYQKKLEGRFCIHAFCLMDNHLHLMISEGTDRFRSEMIEDEGYILSFARYIHQNPVKAKVVKSADDYR